MYARIRAMLLTLDRLIARSSLAIGGADGVLLTFLFHGLFEDSRDAHSGVTGSTAGITVEMFRRFSGSLSDSTAYTFVSPDEISRVLQPSGGKYVLVTFDDGYYNNTRALPLLEEFRAPATLFVSTQPRHRGQGVLVGRRGTQGPFARQLRKDRFDYMVERLKRLQNHGSGSPGVCRIWRQMRYVQ